MLVRIAALRRAPFRSVKEKAGGRPPRAGRSGAPFRRFRAVLGGSRGAVPVFAMAPMYRLDGEPLAVRAANVNADAEVEGRGHHVASPRLGRRKRRLGPACEVPRTAPDWPGQGRGGEGGRPPAVTLTPMRAKPLRQRSGDLTRARPRLLSSCPLRTASIRCAWGLNSHPRYPQAGPLVHGTKPALAGT